MLTRSIQLAGLACLHCISSGLLWIWATLYQPERGWGMQANAAQSERNPDIDALTKRIADLETLVNKTHNKIDKESPEI